MFEYGEDGMWYVSAWNQLTMTDQETKQIISLLKMFSIINNITCMTHITYTTKYS